MQSALGYPDDRIVDSSHFVLSHILPWLSSDCMKWKSGDREGITKRAGDEVGGNYDYRCMEGRDAQGKLQIA
jgi:hypothetical protein